MASTSGCGDAAGALVELWVVCTNVALNIPLPEKGLTAQGAGPVFPLDVANAVHDQGIAAPIRSLALQAGV